MKRILTLFLSVLFVITAFGQQPSGVVMKASVAPVIDGVIDEVWAEANVYDIDRPYMAEVPTLGAAGETTWQALWTDDGMFILLQVTDDAFYPHYSVDPPGNNYEYDKPEIYFDVNYVLADGAGPSTGGSGHYQVAPGFADGSNDGTAFTADNGVVHAFMVEAPNYIAEYFVPFSLLKDNSGIGLDKTGNMGFDVTIIDRDPGDAARRRAVWANNTEGESWSNMDDAGIVTFDGAVAGTYIESITLTGGEITVDNGTLQIEAAILPEEATNKTLLWSVENTTGIATINSTGLLTAVADGEVIVTASSTDGSYEDATVTVTISGQIVTLWEVNVIRNWDFNNLNEDNTPEEWGGWGGDANTPLPRVVDGIAVATPILAADVWQYQFNQQNLTALPNVDYIFSFKAWADAARPITVDFEDIPANSYRRYGITTDPRSADGRSEWTFDITTEPTWYTFDVNFDEILPNTVQKVQWMLALAPDIVYLDSILLVTSEEYNALDVPRHDAVSRVKVYPNPVDANGLLTIVLPELNSQIRIYDNVGRIVEEHYESGNEAIINVSKYSRGVYFVKVNNEKVVKFIK